MRAVESSLAALLAGLILLPSLPVSAAWGAGPGPQDPGAAVEGGGDTWVARGGGGGRGGGGRGGGGHGGGNRAGGRSRAQSGFQGSGSSFSRGDRRPQGGFSQGDRTSRVGNPSLDRPARPSRPPGLAERPGGRPEGSRPRPDLADRPGATRPAGDRPLGDRNPGDRSLGDRNLSDRNLGDRSVGDRSVGDRNLSDRNLSIDRDWNRHVTIGDIDINPGWARPGWGVARPWTWGWYGGWSNPPWGWWGARAAAWGVGTLATAALINAAVDEAVAEQQTTIVVPNTDYRLLYGTVEPSGGTTITFVVQAAGADDQLSADCQRGLINNREPSSAQLAELLNAACQVAFGTAG